MEKESKLKLKNVWDKHAQTLKYSKMKKEDVMRSDDYIYQWLNDIKGKGKRLLDDGCGIGQYVSGSKLLGFKAEGLDISPIAVGIGKKRGEKITLGDMRKLPFKDKSFDVVIAGGSAEHFPETDVALREMNRVMKKGGTLLINVPYKFTLYVITKKIQQGLGMWQAGYEKSFSQGNFIKRLNAAGFRVVDVRKTKISSGKRFPILVNILKRIDEVCLKLGFGGHHIFFKAIKK